jgi:Xaa-Pro aminopeptidase
VTGADAARAARQVLIERGYEEAIFHRTGHGIDRDLHGVGPTLDSIEMRDDRRLVPGVGFSVEPGVYLEGRFGHRTEVDVYMTGAGPEVTPSRIQHSLWLAEG